MMFVPSKIHHSYCQGGGDGVVKEQFGLLCWNVYKKNDTKSAFPSFLSLHYGENADFILLQEAQFGKEKPCMLEGYRYDAAANLETEKSYYGVLTASRIIPTRTKAFLSQEREGVWGTHKSLLLSTYMFEDGTPLLIVNIHAINFRENGAYRREKDRLFSFLSTYEGALVVAGDFNAWNAGRQKKLLETAARLRMKQVPCDQEVKSFLGYPLDFVFYRGLELVSYEVTSTHQLSDHHPIFATFRKQ